MNCTLLLDTHVLVRWIAGAKTLSREQLRLVQAAEQRGLPLGVSAITFVELAQLYALGRIRAKLDFREVLDMLEDEAKFEILTIDTAVAQELPRLLSVLRDPMDSIIVATAYAHRLPLVTSDQRIIDSKLVPTIE